jgi:hypothetical protein
MSTRTVDTEYLARLLDWAEAEHEKKLAGEESEWDQGTWIDIPLYDGTSDSVTPAVEAVANLSCGTTCCLAGKVALDAGAVPSVLGEDGELYLTGSLVDLPDGEKEVDVAEFARQRLGLNIDQCGVLFAGSNTIEDLRVLIPAIIGGEDACYRLDELKYAARAERDDSTDDDA